MIIDSAPLSEVVDALPLAASVDQVLLVVLLGRTRVRQIAELGELLSENGITPAGFALVGSPHASRGYYYQQERKLRRDSPLARRRPDVELARFGEHAGGRATRGPRRVGPGGRASLRPPVGRRSRPLGGDRRLRRAGGAHRAARGDRPGARDRGRAGPRLRAARLHQPVGRGRRLHASSPSSSSPSRRAPRSPSARAPACCSRWPGWRGWRPHAGGRAPSSRPFPGSPTCCSPTSAGACSASPGRRDASETLIDVSRYLLNFTLLVIAFTAIGSRRYAIGVLHRLDGRHGVHGDLRADRRADDRRRAGGPARELGRRRERVRGDPRRRHRALDRARRPPPATSPMLRLAAAA